MRRDLELDVVVGVDLAAREVLDGRGMHKHVVLAVVGAADGPVNWICPLLASGLLRH